jgi:hypothetical protein
MECLLNENYSDIMVIVATVVATVCVATFAVKVTLRAHCIFKMAVKLIAVQLLMRLVATDNEDGLGLRRTEASNLINNCCVVRGPVTVGIKSLGENVSGINHVRVGPATAHPGMTGN